MAGVSGGLTVAAGLDSGQGPGPQSEETCVAARAGETFDVTGKRVYMLGIGGCGMCGLARLLATRGARVSGSDISESEAIEELRSEGISVGLDQATEWIPEETDMVVASAAIPANHPQMLAALRLGRPVLSYAEALGKCMLGRTGIAIAGTHGKSTTTAMLGSALVDAGLEPSVIVGATCVHLQDGSIGTANRNTAPGKAVGVRVGAAAIPAGTAAGNPGILVVEACEFNRSFHNFRPTLASISSVEADHLDVYGTFEAVIEAFREFAKLLPPAEEGGKLLIGHDNAHRREVTAGLRCEVETIGFNPEADWVVAYDVEDRRVTLRRKGELVASWTMKLPGAHNAMNASVAVALGSMAGAEPAKLAASLSEFRGVDRRMQLLGERAHPRGGTIRVYDDYGHHPTEVETTLRALREFERPEARGGRLICVFQPHQHSRTRHLLEEFAAAFGSADIVIVPHIYFVRDSQEEKQKVTAGDLVDKLRQRGVRAMHLYPFEAIVEQLENLCQPNDLVVVMGAGPVWQVAKGYLAGGDHPVAAGAGH